MLIASGTVLLKFLLGLDESVSTLATLTMIFASWVCIAATIVSERRVRRIMEKIGDRRACTLCGYDLTDRPNADCPECGRKAIESGLS
ncbi:MAG: hypothetical protein AAGI46_11880 [Planctomycetota bacterium]